MIINNILDHIFINTSNLAVLRILNERVTGISGRETARLSGISLRAAQISLRNLENLAIVKRQPGGREHLFTLNRDNFIATKIITKVFSLEKEFKTSIYKRIKNEIEELTDSVIIFGSVARMEEYINSDLDVCIVYKGSKQKIVNRINYLRDSLNTEYGITLAPLYINASEFKQKAIKNKPPVNRILKEGLVISGSSITKLTR